MRLFVSEVLLENLNSNIKKIEKIYKRVDDSNSEAFFIYSFALFESAICESIRHILAAFPEKIKGDAYPKLKTNEVIDNLFLPQKILDKLIAGEIIGISKGNIKSMIDSANSICAIDLEYDEKIIFNISAERNRLIHENTDSKREYILGSSNYLKTNQFDEDMCKKYMEYILDLLKEFFAKLELKYKGYTKIRLIKELWEDIFSTPLLRFKDCILIRDDFFQSGKKEVQINFEHLKSVAKDISSSEKFYLAVFLQQYSSSANSQIFEFNDLPALSLIFSKEKLYEILHVFIIYPYLFNGENVADR